MSDADHNDDGFDEAFKGFGDDVTPPAQPGAAAEPPKNDDDNPTPPAPEPPKEEPKKDDPPKPEDKKEEPTPPADPAKTPEDPAKPPTPPETPPASEEPKPLTEDTIRNIIKEVRTEERTSGQALQEQTKEVLEAYYPDGLSNVLTTPDGKELRTPQDVVDASNGEMSMDQATQWLMNEQYKLDNSIAKIKKDAEVIAETTLKFKQDGVEVLQRYEPLFKVYPHLQAKVWDQYKKLVKADESKNVILSAPDMAEFYDTVLEPYRLAYEYSTKQPATAPQPPAPEPPKPSVDDRLDEGGDGGTSQPDDPNDFAQQVKKELAREL